MKMPTRKEAISLVVNGLMDAKTYEEQEKISDMADEFVCAGLLTEEEVEELFDEFGGALDEGGAAE